MTSAKTEQTPASGGRQPSGTLRLRKSSELESQRTGKLTHAARRRDVFAPTGQQHVSLGQRPRNLNNMSPEAPTERHYKAINGRFPKPMVPPFQGSEAAGDFEPRALPWAIIWMARWAGGLHQRPSREECKVGKHTKGNKDGVKAERRSIRVIPKARFDSIETTTELVTRLFNLKTNSEEVAA